MLTRLLSLTVTVWMVPWHPLLCTVALPCRSCFHPIFSDWLLLPFHVIIPVVAIHVPGIKVFVRIPVVVGPVDTLPFVVLFVVLVPVVGVSVRVPVGVAHFVAVPFVALEVFEGVAVHSAYLVPSFVLVVVDCDVLVNLLCESVCTLYPSLVPVVVAVVDLVLFLNIVVFFVVVVVLGIGTDCVVLVVCF